ncbi:MAG TPA: CGNR zinc finger domain-containing protein [Candidatus Limnocylindria bacterium]|nr:CGNR zinc finger domain-containing protein [Candidatus Limnocylindria bacterium]
MRSEAFASHLGSLALNFTATVRQRGGRPEERLPAPADLARWLHEADLTPPDATPTPAEHQAALRLREAIYAAATAVLSDTPPNPADIATINEASKADRRIPQLDPTTLTKTYRQPKAPIAAALATIADDAITALTTDRAHLAVCEDETCGALIRLNPRGPRRRWCSMAACGNRHKVATYRTRH